MCCLMFEGKTQWVNVYLIPGMDTLAVVVSGCIGIDQRSWNLLEKRMHKCLLGNGFEPVCVCVSVCVSVSVCLCV